MCYDSKRKLTFLANKRGKIFVFDSQMNLQTTITHDSNGNPIGRPYGMMVDSKGNYWVCDKDNGLYKITPNGGGYTVTNLRHNDDDPYSLSHNGAYQAVEDKQGNIWVATYGGGVNIIKKDKNDRYIALHSKNVMKHYPQNTYKKVRTITVAKDGKIWAGSTDGILIMQLNNNNITIEPLESPEDIQKGLMSNDIVNLLCAPDGTMWVGTNSGGLSQTTTKDEQGIWQFKNYGIEDGLPSEEIRSITFDDRGNIWLATDHILCSYDVKKKVFTSFSTLEGVDDTMLSEASAMMGNNGKILFGTLSGFYTVDRKKLTNSTGSLLKLQITDFFLNGELQSPRLTSNYNYYVPGSRRVELPYHGCQFSFRFAALNYQLQHRMHYQYKLEGYDKDWLNADKSRTVSFKNIPTGTYRFQVKAYLLESPEAYDMRTIEVVVPPHFLLSSVAVWIYIPFIATLLLGGLWWYQEKLRKRHLALLQQQPATPDDDTSKEEPDESPAVLDDEAIIQEETTDSYEIMED